MSILELILLNHMSDINIINIYINKINKYINNIKIINLYIDYLKLQAYNEYIGRRW